MTQFKDHTEVFFEGPMARKKDLCRASNGLYLRNIGWKRTPKGYAQHKFYLGRDQHNAELASLRLEQLWEQVSKRWQRENGYELHPTDRPVWDDVTLTIAEAVRNGESVARVYLPSPYSEMIPESPFIADWLHKLQNDIGVIKIELHDSNLQQEAEEQLRKQGQRLLDMGRRLLQQGSGGGTLHSALDAYVRWIQNRYVDVEKQLTPWGAGQTRQVLFIRRHLPDAPLAELDGARVDDMIDILRLRPSSEKGTPVSASWARNCIKQFRHFLRWLNKHHEFGWKRPADLEIETVKIPLTPTEKSAQARTAQVQTYSIDELRVLFEYATPFDRLLMLLALNCGFGRAEVASLELADVHLRQLHPHQQEVGYHSTCDESWIFRIRHKSGVYGEWILWQMTVKAIDWWFRQRTKIASASAAATLLLTKKGHRYDTPTKGNHTNFQIPNRWFALVRRIRKDRTNFRQLSFNKLRKTAGNLVRTKADGEVAGVFLCHGTPVSADRLLDLYSNKPFGKVFEALKLVEKELQPLWETVVDPFAEEQKKGGPNISRGTILRIQEMARAGCKTSEIVIATGVSLETVRRWKQRG